MIVPSDPTPCPIHLYNVNADSCACAWTSKGGVTVLFVRRPGRNEKYKYNRKVQQKRKSTKRPKVSTKRTKIKTKLRTKIRAKGTKTKDEKDIIEDRRNGCPFCTYFKCAFCPRYCPLCHYLCPYVCPFRLLQMFVTCTCVPIAFFVSSLYFIYVQYCVLQILLYQTIRE